VATRSRNSSQSGLPSSLLGLDASTLSTAAASNALSPKQPGSGAAPLSSSLALPDTAAATAAAAAAGSTACSSAHEMVDVPASSQSAAAPDADPASSDAGSAQATPAKKGGGAASSGSSGKRSKRGKKQASAAAAATAASESETEGAQLSRMTLDLEASKDVGATAAAVGYRTRSHANQ